MNSRILFAIPAALFLFACGGETTDSEGTESSAEDLKLPAAKKADAGTTKNDAKDAGTAKADAKADTKTSCTCDPSLPICETGTACPTPGTGGATCGSAEYCAPCCDPTNNCDVKGMCAVTKIATETCLANYECCSDVCSNGECKGGCGVTF